MQPEADRILPSRLPALCRLLADDVSTAPAVRTTVLENLLYWWARSTDEAVVQDLQATIQLLAGSPVAGEVARGLVGCVDAADDLLASRTIELLGCFSSEAEAAVPVLVKALTMRTGSSRWRAATALAELGIQDEWILARLPREPANEVRTATPTPETAHAFDQVRFRALYQLSLAYTSAAEKGRALEDLVEYMFLSVPGLNTIARNLRTLAEEIDLAVSNYGDGFWRQIGDPFIVECKNRTEAVDARTIRDFRVKLQTKGLRGGFIITTSQLTKDAMVEIRQALADGRAIVAVENEHLADIAEGRPLLEVLSERFYKCRLL
ncbi:MAG: restriction endonuclease [Thermodesulfovibrionales bacterium]|jgi:Holliday junction resolvase-like predicted endonuclease